MSLNVTHIVFVISDYFHNPHCLLV